MKLYIGNLYHTMTEMDLGALLGPQALFWKSNLTTSTSDHLTRQSSAWRSMLSMVP